MFDRITILLIDNDPQAARFLKDRLSLDAGYTVTMASSGKAGLEYFQESNFDLVISKYELPDIDYARLFREMKNKDSNLIFIVLLENDNPVVLEEVAKAGVYGYLAKPVNLEKLFFLVKKGIELRSLSVTNHKLISSLQEQNSSLQKQNSLMAKRVEESTRNLTRLYEDLRTTYLRTIKVLAQAIDARDHYTHSHSENVARYAVAIAEEMKLPTKDIELLRQACELHDLGKIGVGDDVLLKPSGLNPEEWEKIKCHPQTAAQILEPLAFLNGVTDMVRQHHEHFDGTGYPDKLKGDQILLGARIIHLADAYDAMVSARAYRKTPLTREQAVGEIKKNTGIQFDPKVVAAFLRIVDNL